MKPTVAHYGIPNRHGTGWSDPLPYQVEAVNYAVRQLGKIVVAEWGRGTGKSTVLWLAAFALMVLFPGMRVLCIAPAAKTLSDGIFAVIRAIQQVFVDQYGYDVFVKWNTSPQNPRIELANGSEVVFRLGSRIDDARGGTFGLILIEEAGFVEADAESWAAFLPCIRGRGPHMILAGGTPSSPTSVLALLKRFWQEGAETGDPHIREFTDSHQDPPETYGLFYSVAKTVDNPHFPRWIIEFARATMSPEMFGQEFEAKARKFSGLVCPEFDRAVHVAPFDLGRLTQEPGWVLCELLDWGDSKAHRATVAIRQDNMSRPPEFWILRDEPLDNHTDEMILARVIADRKSFGKPVTHAIVDPRPEKSRKLAWSMLRHYDIAVAWHPKTQEQTIIGTVDWLHRLLRLEDGTVPLHIRTQVAAHPSNRPGGRGCVVSLEEYRLTESGIRPDEFTNKPKDDNRTAHFCDLLRYLGMNLKRVGFEWPIVLPSMGQKPRAA